MSAAAAPARKRATGPGELAGLMAAMGSTKGFDPMPPDQYLYFLGKKESPLQRLLALVRSKTIRKDHRSAHCVDENGKELRQADLRRELGMDWGNFRRALNEAVARGLVRVGSRSSPTEAAASRSHRQNGGASAHPHRVLLCGSVAESIGYEEATKDALVSTDSSWITPAHLKIVAGWPKERQDRFYGEFHSEVKLIRQIEADLIAKARDVRAARLDRLFSAHELPRKHLPKRRAPESRLVQVTLLAAAIFESAQTQSVLTSAPESVPTDARASVPTAASLLTQRTTRGEETSSSSVVISGAQRGDDDEGGSYLETFESVREWMQDYARDFGRGALGSPDPPIVRRVVEALNGASLAQLEQLSIRMFAQGLGPRQSYGWFVTVVEEEFRENQNKKSTRKQTAGGAP
jgi:hypothetical protein